MSKTREATQDVFWAPSHPRLRPRTEDNDADIDPIDLSKMDDDPISYFLTPAPSLDPYGQDPMDFEMDFDAGIEDFKHPPPIVRSVSPSSLEGLSLPPYRPPTPPKSPGTPDSVSSDQPLTPDDHDDYYMHFAAKGRSLTFPIRLSDLTGKKQKQKSQAARQKTAFLAPESPNLSAGLASAANRGRPRTSGISPGPSGGSPVGRIKPMSSRRSPHSWREPSPDVWSIEEETQEDAADGGIRLEGNSDTIQDQRGETAPGMTTAIDIPAAKPKKKVRFVLPVTD